MSIQNYRSKWSILQTFTGLSGWAGQNDEAAGRAIERLNLEVDAYEV